jgi:benzoyl-CoA reductase/2-hydroxyglutaryl-CoA dehydratase subunit BcrC/BadD/HgdB
MHGLAPGLAFCSLLQTRLGAITKGIIPMPDLLVPSCLMCDQSPKVDELLHEVYGVPVTYIDHIFDSGGDQWPDAISSQRVQYLASQVEDAMDKFRQLFGYQVTEMEVRQPLDAESEIFRTQVEVWELMKVDPMPLRFKDLSITLGPTSWSRRAVREEAEVLNILRKELEKRVKDGVGVVERGAPRVMASMLPMDSAIQGMFEELGLAIPVSSLVPIPTAGRAMNSFSSVWEEVANSIITRRGANYSGLAYLLQVKQLAKLQNVDGVVLFHHVGCRQYNTWLPKAKEVIEKELGIPSLILEGDYCDFRDYNAKQMRTRLETFAQVVKTAKASREGAR